MHILNLDEQEIVAGGHMIYIPWPIRPPRIPIPTVDIEAIKKEIAQSGTISGVSILGSVAGIGIRAPLTASPWSNRDC